LGILLAADFGKLTELLQLFPVGVAVDAPVTIRRFEVG